MASKVRPILHIKRNIYKRLRTGIRWTMAACRLIAETWICRALVRYTTGSPCALILS